jgi:anaerobic ribonucleoside-triphosphate reductase activating protein
VNYYDINISLQEVPGEVSLSFTITGCSLRCKGCHSSYLWKESNGCDLSTALFEDYLDKYDGYISCVLFMGGEWHQRELAEKLSLAQEKGLNTCLYTGEDDVDDEIKKHLTWLKTGKWEKDLGGLKEKDTNQQFIEVKSQRKLNFLFADSLPN